MGRPRVPLPVKLVCGLLSSDPDLLNRARQRLVRRYGAVDLESETWPFTQTRYYEHEMGPDLQRRFLAFERLVAPDALPEIKLETNKFEAEIADDCTTLGIVRPVNLDPGYVDLTRLVLATTKDRAHRIYLSQGIYAEVTLIAVGDGWSPGGEWTYADFREPRYYPYLSSVRRRLIEQRAHLAAGDAE